MKAILHNDELILAAENGKERIFLQDLIGEITVRKGNWLERNYKFTYSPYTQTVKVVKNGKEE